MKTILIVWVLMLMTTSALARQSKPIQCMNDIRRLSMSLDSFRYEYGIYPAPETWRTELVGTSNCTLNTHRIKFVESEQDLVDRWGNAYVFIAPGIRNTNTFDLYSLGSDGRSASGGNDIDDINNWNPNHTWLYDAYRVATHGQAERRGRVIFVIPFLVLGVAVAAEIILIKMWIIRRVRRSQPPSSGDVAIRAEPEE